MVNIKNDKVFPWEKFLWNGFCYLILYTYTVHTYNITTHNLLYNRHIIKFSVWLRFYTVKKTLINIYLQFFLVNKASPIWAADHRRYWVGGPFQANPDHHDLEVTILFFSPQSTEFNPRQKYKVLRVGACRR
jgi:hypothetical protein